MKKPLGVQRLFGLEWSRVLGELFECDSGGVLDGIG
jgi:hypothetical protein